MSTATPARHRPAVLYDIDWQTYSYLLRAFERSGRKFRLTYDRGRLEIMSPLWQHESPAYLLGRFIDVLTDELNLACRAGRCVTLRRKRKRRGLEPDNCFWIKNALHFQGRMRLDLRTDPPPDLAIEIEFTRKVLNRMNIYAALGVPEVWLLGKPGLSFHILNGGAYEVRPNSVSFPALASADLAQFVAQMGQVDDTTLVRQFRAWVREQLLGKP